MVICDGCGEQFDTRDDLNISTEKHLMGLMVGLCAVVRNV